MTVSVRPSDIKKLEQVFGTEVRMVGTNYRFELAPQDPVRKLALEIYPSIPIGKRRGTLISVYTPNAHLQLHFCSGFVVSEMLGEVTFVGEHDGKVSGLIVEKEGGCSLFANVDRALVSGDFTRLGPEVMLSGIALSLTDTILERGRRSAPRRAARPKKKTAARR
jgi:hypothetical protein